MSTPPLSVSAATIDDKLRTLEEYLIEVSNRNNRFHKPSKRMTSISECVSVTSRPRISYKPAVSSPLADSNAENRSMSMQNMMRSQISLDSPQKILPVELPLRQRHHITSMLTTLHGGISKSRFSPYKDKENTQQLGIEVESWWNMFGWRLYQRKRQSRFRPAAFGNASAASTAWRFGS